MDTKWSPIREKIPMSMNMCNVKLTVHPERPALDCPTRSGDDHKLHYYLCVCAFVCLNDRSVCPLILWNLLRGQNPTKGSNKKKASKCRERFSLGPNFQGDNIEENPAES